MRQTAAARGATAGSSRKLRLDPATLPLRYTAVFDEGGRRADATIFLDRDQVIVKRRSSIGAPLTVCLPISAFDGVAVRMTPIGIDGDIEVTVEIRHRDPSLCLPLLVDDDPAAVADDWQAWSTALGLPLLLVDQDGNIIRVENADGAFVSLPPKPRRHHAQFKDRRPRFLVRRKSGRSGVTERLAKREIIARD